MELQGKATSVPIYLSRKSRHSPRVTKISGIQQLTAKTEIKYLKGKMSHQKIEMRNNHCLFWH